MAARTKSNGRTNGSITHLAEDGLQNMAASFTSTAGTLSRLAQEVSDGAELQTRSLDEALSGVNEMSASLKETATQSASVSTSAEQFVNSITEMTASIEQVTVNVRSLVDSAATSASTL